VRLQFVHVEELLNSRCGYDVRSDRSCLDLAHVLGLSARGAPRREHGKIGSAARSEARLGPTLLNITVFRGGGRRPLLSPKRESEAAG
jgi:hypothetical protein